jgi:HTH-type transcriptional regulator/antitoxin MqsA
MTECLYCKGELEERRVSRIQEYEGRWYLIENLPALVCRQCGEVYYTPDTHDRVLDLVKAGTRPTRTETLSVLDASAA